VPIVPSMSGNLPLSENPPAKDSEVSLFTVASIFRCWTHPRRADDVAIASTSLAQARKDHGRYHGSSLLATPIITAVLCFVTSSLLVHLGVLFGESFLVQNVQGGRRIQENDRNSRTNGDGVWYQQIANHGYSFNADRGSNVVFFPAYPLLSACVAKVTRLRTSDAMVLVSNVCLLAAFIVMARYLRIRRVSPQADHDYETGNLPCEVETKAHEGTDSFLPPERDYASDWQAWTLVTMAVWPTGLFFRMGYTESLFLLTILLAMYGMLAEWRRWAIALVIGLATGTRSVGIALLLPFVFQLWTSSSGRKQFVGRAAYLLPLSCWGLLGYILYLGLEFDNPLVFATNQHYWVSRPTTEWTEQASALLTLEPFWGTYEPSNLAYWQNFDPGASPLFSLRFADPIFFGAIIVAVTIGWRKEWLTANELLLSLGLLGIPLLLHSYPGAMQSHGRYASIIFPGFLVIGRLITTLPPILAMFAVIASSLWMTVLSSLFAAWHPIY